jgi:hypothetical protein
MRTLPRLRAVALALVAASVGPALAQAKHEMKGKILLVEPSAKHIVVEEIHGRKYKQPLALIDASKIELPTGAGTLEQVHVGDEVIVSYEPGPSGQQVVELRVTKPAGG